MVSDTTTTKVIGHAIIGGKSYMLYVSATDGTAIEITVRDVAGNLKNLKDILRGQTLQGFELSVGTPSDLDLVQFKNKDGGIVAEWIGCINVALGHVPQLVVGPLNIPITDGVAFEITTTD